MPSYEEVTQRAGSLRSLTGLTEAEFQALLPHFEQAFMTYMDDRTIDGSCRATVRLMNGVFSKPVCLLSMALSAGLQ
jgi:hypothetical protein